MTIRADTSRAAALTACPSMGIFCGVILLVGPEMLTAATGWLNAYVPLPNSGCTGEGVLFRG